MKVNGGPPASGAPPRGPRQKMNRSTQKLNALPHGPEAKGLGGRTQLAPNIEAPAVILDFHRHGVPSTGQSDPYAMRVGMGDDIGKRTLKHFVQGCLITRGQVRSQPDGIKPNFDSGSPRELARIELHRWYETLLVPDRRPQIKGKMPDTL